MAKLLKVGMLASQAGNIQSGNEEVLYIPIPERVSGRIWDCAGWGDVKKINNDLSTEQMGPPSCRIF